jgi:hypothetical protein
LPPQIAAGGDDVGYTTTEIEQLYHEERARTYAQKTEHPDLDEYDHTPSDGRIDIWTDFEIRRRHGSLIRENGYLDHTLDSWIDFNE